MKIIVNNAYAIDKKCYDSNLKKKPCHYNVMNRFGCAGLSICDLAQEYLQKIVDWTYAKNGARPKRS